MRWFFGTLAWVGKIIAALVLLLVVLLTIDAAGRHFVLKGDVEHRIERSTTSDSRRLVVYLQGVLAKADGSSAEVRPVWLEHGDVLMVDWTGDRFKGDEVAQSVADVILDKTDNYDEFVFIGSSMGGLLSYDTALLLKDAQPDIKMKFVLIDAPAGRSDFQPGLRWPSYAANVTGGPLINRFSRLYFDKTFVNPKEENIEPRVNREVLAERVEEAKTSFSLSMNNDWVRYIAGHDKLVAGSLAEYPVVLIRSHRDTDTVNERFILSWLPVFGSGATVLVLDTTHVGYNERPETWRAGFNEAFELLGIS